MEVIVAPLPRKAIRVKSQIAFHVPIFQKGNTMFQASLSELQCVL